MAFLLQAEFLERKYQVCESLDIDPQERQLILLYLMRGLLKGSIYSDSAILSNPEVQASVKVHIIGYLIRRLESMAEEHQQLFATVEEETAQFIQTNYPYPADRQKTRTLQLAINMLIAKGTSDDPTKFNLTPDQFEAWAARWKQELHPSP